MLKRLLLPALLATTTAALAEVPKVATDIAPVQGLVAAVMGDLGQPALVVPRGASPHDHALRPSEAGHLQGADLVVWIGPDLMPNLVKPLETLAGGALIMTLADLPGSHLLPSRTEAVFGEVEDHGHDDEHGDEHEAEDHGAEHDHGDAAHDPHLWLDPDNALLWLDAIATQLSKLDPDNADTYAANAAAAKAAVTAAVGQAQARLSPVHETPYLSLHDAYQYFEEVFDLHPLGAISLSDATTPGPARLASLRAALMQRGVTCVLAEPGGPEGFLQALGDTASLQVSEVDPLGAALPDGAGFYPALITDTADRIADCLTPAS
ncbi:zinc ABC transporter substrate-binding protein [Puniceibacterium sediminis]|uniref:High-affinity zinc uptake system protein ZnuA n=1 Tax=Puniceibacterium sediminis TaxID=1608407 RepID=A0A238WZZ6_9RHOB|nr:zinc ABC transporter substrate-binding protein [Puniceibacterium sediminis]SNR52146.1 zinc transport system substrate-binding protein [Puniceibacterium sediminis]